MGIVATSRGPSAAPSSSSSAECGGNQPSGFGFGFVTTGPVSPAVICVQLYYYNTSSLTLNLTDALSIWASQPNASGSTTSSFSGESNFTVSPSVNQLTIGGPHNASEGTYVSFAVTYRQGASGVYELGMFQSLGLQAYLLGSQEPQSCGSYGRILAGSSGLPNYAGQESMCITFETSSATIAIPGMSYRVIPGLYFRVVGVTNSSGTQTLP